MRTITRGALQTTRQAFGRITGAHGRHKPRRPGALISVSIIAFMSVLCSARAATPGVAYFSHAAGHNLYLLNEDGNLFRWGQARYGDNVSTPSPAVVPYYETNLTVAPSPSGARWKQATGSYASELFLDEAGKAYFNWMSLTQSTRLLAIEHPEPNRKWRQISSGGWLAALLDDAGGLYELKLSDLAYFVRGHPSELLPVPNPWLAQIGQPATFGPSLEAVAIQGFFLTRTTQGEIYGRGNSYGGLTGSEPTVDGAWQRVARPLGVNAWLNFKASESAAVAVGDDGNVYYWGQRIPGSPTADFGVDSRIPVAIPKPVGVSGWKSMSVVGGFVLLVSQEGGLYGFGSAYSFLQEPFSPGISPPFTVAMLASNPLLQGPFDSVQCGTDYVIARKSDGTDVRWGQFMRLERYWFPGSLPPGQLALPATITGLPERRSPAARVLSPASFSRIGIGEPLPLAAEVFPLEGTLTSVEFLVNRFVVPGVVQVEGSVATSTWQTAVPGEFAVAVRVTDSAGRVTLSQAVTIQARHAVHWQFSTNRIREVAGEGLGTTAELQLTRTELPYPAYHPFSYRFRMTPLKLLGKDFAITGATPLNDGSGNWEVLFAAGQKTKSVLITALEDEFTDANQRLYFTPAYDWSKSKDYIPPGNDLDLWIEDATPTDGPSLVEILADDASRFSFQGDPVPLTVSVPKSLTDQPAVRLISDQFLYLQYAPGFVEDLTDRWLFHFTVRNLDVGLHSVRARVGDGWQFGYGRYRDSAPLGLRVWDRNGLPNVRVAAENHEVVEADQSQVVVTVSRDGSLAESMSVDLNVRGTALSGSDYDAFPTTVTIPANAGYVQFVLRLHDDSRTELDELIEVSAAQRTCTQLPGCVVVATGSVLRVIMRDDDPLEVAASADAQVVASPFSNASYLRTASGQLYAWGENLGGSLGLGDLPAELAGLVPWPRRVRGLPDGEKWQDIMLGPNQAFGTSAQGNLYAWGAGFATSGRSFQIPSPRWVVPSGADVEPFFIKDGELVERLGTGRLQRYRLTTYMNHLLYPVGPEGLPALRVTPQLRVLLEDGYFHDASDWGGLYADRYPLAPGAGYWLDAASSGELLVAMDELRRLFRVQAGSYQYDPALGRSRLSYSTEALPALPDGRVVSRLLGNELGVVALAVDGSAYSLPPAGASSLIPFPAGVTRWVSLAAGKKHFLAVGDDGRVYAWGDNTLGQLGDGEIQAAAAPRRLPVFVGVNDPGTEFPVVNFAQPPFARFYQMDAEIFLGGPSSFTALARAFDPDGLIDRVEFLINGEVAAVAVFDTTRKAFVADVFAPHPGEYQLTVRAWDDSGLSGVSTSIPLHVDDPGRYPVVKVWNIPSGTAEGYGFPGYFIISRQGIADVPLTVYFDIHGTATEGTDYPALPRSAVIPAGAAEVRIPVIARPDFADEDIEEVNLTIRNPGCDPATAEPGSGCYRIGSPNTAPVFIVDYLRPGDAYLPFVAMTLLTSPIAREGTTNVVRLEVRRYGSFVEELPVTYSLGGIAENGVDYLPLSGVAVIPAGADRTTITLSAIEDLVAEPYERVVVTLLNPGCEVGFGSAEGCYLSDERNSLVLIVGDKPILPPLPGGPTPNSVPRPVLFDGIEFFEGQGTIISVISDPGAVFALQTSADLVSWRTLGELTSVSGQIEFFDGEAAGESTRYYRIVPPTNP